MESPDVSLSEDMTPQDSCSSGDDQENTSKTHRGDLKRTRNKDSSAEVCIVRFYLHYTCLPCYSADENRIERHRELIDSGRMTQSEISRRKLMR